MTIYNGPSIYNQGGSGGGAYKDGGALVDGDFIKVENNTISTYDNTARSDINYYFELADNEIINAVVELTTSLNATVHVYIVQNGLFIPIGNVGGDTVNAGDEYKVNITGNSFSLELVTPAQAEPEYVNLMGTVYGVKKVNGLYWIDRNFMGDVGTWIDDNSTRYYDYAAFENINLDGWRLPTKTEINSLINSLYPDTAKAMKSTSGWYSGGNGDNSTGLNFKPYGFYNVQLADNTRISRFFFKDPLDTSVYYFATLAYDSNSSLYTNSNNKVVQWQLNVRLVHDL